MHVKADCRHVVRTATGELFSCFLDWLFYLYPKCNLELLIALKAYIYSMYNGGQSYSNDNHQQSVVVTCVLTGCALGNRGMDPCGSPFVILQYDNP